jgi:hypothetical protein
MLAWSLDHALASAVPRSREETTGASAAWSAELYACAT